VLDFIEILKIMQIFALKYWLKYEFFPAGMLDMHRHSGLVLY
jgi:hypothetical protein